MPNEKGCPADLSKNVPFRSKVLQPSSLGTDRYKVRLEIVHEVGAVHISFLERERKGWELFISRGTERFYSYKEGSPIQETQEIMEWKRGQSNLIFQFPRKFKGHKVKPRMARRWGRKASTRKYIHSLILHHLQNPISIMDLKPLSTSC